MKTAIIQGIIPHYREDFFKTLKKTIDFELYIYETNNSSKNMKFSELQTKQLKSKNIMNKLIYFNFIDLLKHHEVIILPGNMRLISVWILLILGKILNKKIILWGHGISVINYLKEEKKLNFIRVVFHKLASHTWLYTEREKEIWKHYIDDTKLTALGNSIDTKKIFDLPKLDKELLKKKYNISTKLNLIYCARFTKNRRIDLMIDLIKELKDENIGLIIIGDGDYKPNFSDFEHVYDFGAVYDDVIKHELFTIADLYFQPAWTGLSIVEAMAYGKPIITFERTENILQCVEYAYIEHYYNGFIGKSILEIKNFLLNISVDTLRTLERNCKNTIIKELNTDNMVRSVTEVLKND